MSLGAIPGCPSFDEVIDLQATAASEALSQTKLDLRLRQYLQYLQVPSSQHEMLITQVLQVNHQDPAVALQQLQTLLAGHRDNGGTEAAWLQWRLTQLFGTAPQLKVIETAPTKPLMYTLLPVHRQSMVPAHLERSLLRRLLLAYVYRPLGKLLRQLQLLRKRTLES